MKRIHRLLYPQGPTGVWAPLLAAVSLVVTATVALAAWPSEPPQQSLTSAQPQTDRAETSPYARWLNQEVVYIIADEERTAFQKLTTDEEREKFIEQFWRRRDPKPETTENEFRKEHYFRIMYANERFRTASGRAGWQTDRGRMYIVYGPPDQIESHPSGDAGSPQFEIWRFGHIEGIGNNLSVSFIDRTGSGDYHLVPGNSR